ncbi:MAG: hypothetical protein WD081_04085 [Gammaproteobacteria bacterium]
MLASNQRKNTVANLRRTKAFWAVVVFVSAVIATLTWLIADLALSGEHLGPPLESDTGVLEVFTALGIVIVVGLAVILVLYWGLLGSAISSFLSPDGNPENSFNPKGIFDHIRNYFISGAILFGGVQWYGSQDVAAVAVGAMLIVVAVCIAGMNFMHGKRCITHWLDEEVNVSELAGVELWLWVSGIAKWPAYALLPILMVVVVLRYQVS